MECQILTAESYQKHFYHCFAFLFLYIQDTVILELLQSIHCLFCFFKSDQVCIRTTAFFYAFLLTSIHALLVTE